MRCKFIAVVFVVLVPAVAKAQYPVQVYAGQPGPYEVHHWQHRTTNFDRQPYFATNPPVYYSEQRLVRTYGWTPFPFLGTQYPVKEAVIPMSDAVEERAVPVAPTKKRMKTNKPRRSDA